MKYLVCRDKESERLFIQTRLERLTQISVLLDEGITIPSNVLKEFDEEEDAINYIINQNHSDKLINKIIK